MQRDFRADASASFNKEGPMEEKSSPFHRSEPNVSLPTVYVRESVLTRHRRVSMYGKDKGMGGEV